MLSNILPISIVMQMRKNKMVRISKWSTEQLKKLGNWIFLPPRPVTPRRAYAWSMVRASLEAT
jgi:hypothetical protein